MTQGAQVGGVLPALVGLFDLREWPRSSWGQASFKLALSRATCGRRLFPSRLEGMSRVCTQRFSLSLAAGGAILGRCSWRERSRHRGHRHRRQ